MSLRRPLAGVVTGAVLIALVSGAIYLLRDHVPVLGLAVLYLLAVIPVAVVWGLVAGVVVSVASMLVFNFFFLPPIHTFTLQDSSNWFALGVFVVTAVVVSELAASSRRRATESALLAEIAASLLEHREPGAELERIAAEAAQRIAGRAGDDHGRRRRSEGRGRSAGVVRGDGRRVGTIVPRRLAAGGAAARRRLLPALASLLGVAIDRERLADEALEAETLRRSDAVKTAVLRSVSHDLRSPLMAILTSASALARSDLDLDQDDQRELRRDHSERGRPARTRDRQPARPLPARGRRGAARA